MLRISSGTYLFSSRRRTRRDVHPERVRVDHHTIVFPGLAGARSGPLYSIETLELAEPGPGELRIRVVAVGMCHTDILPRVPGFMAPPPITPGYEGAGIVEAVGPGVFGIVPGTHVLCSFDSCGTCANCLDAHPAYCETFFPRNLTGLRLDCSAGATDTDGRPVAARWFGQSTFATHAVVTARNVVPVDSSLPLELLAPLGCGIQTGAGSVLHAMRVRAGTSIAVFGVGAVGMGCRYTHGSTE